MAKEKEELAEGIKKINMVRVGEIELHSSTESLKSLVKHTRRLIKSYDTYTKLNVMDKVRRGVGGIG